MTVESESHRIAHATVSCGERKAAERACRHAVSDVLAGTGSYDSLDDGEQATVRVKWVERMTALRGGLDLEARFRADGESYSEVDQDGILIVHPGRR